MMGSRQSLWRAVLLLGLAALAWRITAVGVAGRAVGTLDTVGEAAARQALDWYPGQAAALYRLGVGSLRRDGGAAERLLAAAYLHNPTDQRALVMLAGIALGRGESGRADALVEQAGVLRPVDPWVQQDLGRYWLERGQPQRAFQHWALALEANPRLSSALFATFRQLLKEPAMHDAFASLTRAPPPWWNTFFTDTAKRAETVESVRQLYRMRRESTEVPLTYPERQAYFERLLRDGLIEEAYLAWANSLNAEQRQRLGPLFNGGFEGSLTGLGFDWQVGKVDRAEIAPAHAEGDDRQALRLRFRLLREPFDQLAQPLFLSAGAYAVAGSFRSRDLMSEGGFRWVVRCRAPAQTLLGESARIFGAEPWTPFRFEIEVPGDCLYQEIRLVSADASGLDKTLTDGELWFDDMSIRRIDGLSPEARASIEGLRAEEQAAEKKPGGH
ncbi:hypothetical protein [uncultured Thiodictyon sp.]|uniref:hypothetical protein n=1 Tax=uncultured Thiodictyon sp. TaxID=1846217 RepID=UPI0025D52E2B|nr:hypothetical protein [uncultured Thiodictyon sp.]